MLGVGVVAALLAVPGFFVALSILRTDPETRDEQPPSPPQVWLPGSVEEQIARRVANAADAMGSPPRAARLIEASITVVDASSQTGNLPLAKGRAYQ